VYNTDWNNFTRTNLALYFSRTGEDDFVAGPGVYRQKEFAHYPQGIVHDGKLYIAYTRKGGRNIYGVRPESDSDRGIGISIVHPIPEPDVYYVWPRDRDLSQLSNELPVQDWTSKDVEAVIERLNPDYVYQRPYIEQVEGREVIVFKERGTAGVEIDPVDFSRDEVLEVVFEFNIRTVQGKGSLVLCSFGGESPIRIGVPSNRPGLLYAHARGVWHRIARVKKEAWQRLALLFGAEQFSVRVGDAGATTIENPVRRPDRRLYLGDGYEVDPWESNRDSEFLIDLASLRTRLTD